MCIYENAMQQIIASNNPGYKWEEQSGKWRLMPKRWCGDGHTQTYTL